LRAVRHSERIIPDETAPGVVALHLKRYVFAEPWCRGKEVLDCACGVGYGTAHLAAVAARVVGGDLSEEAIAYARRRYARDNVEFRVLDAAALPFDDDVFDTVVSFETIEHLPDREAHLGEVARVLRANGTYVVSTPRAERTTETPGNPFHRVEYSEQDFRLLLARHFGEVDLYGQVRRQSRRHRALRRLDVLGLRRRVPALRRARVLTGTPATEAVTLDDVAIVPGRTADARELVAVCRP
jgi:SAM-dependent methyltransferase